MSPGTDDDADMKSHKLTRRQSNTGETCPPSSAIIQASVKALRGISNDLRDFYTEPGVGEEAKRILGYVAKIEAATRMLDNLDDAHSRERRAQRRRPGDGDYLVRARAVSTRKLTRAESNTETKLTKAEAEALWLSCLIDQCAPNRVAKLLGDFGLDWSSRCDLGLDGCPAFVFKKEKLVIFTCDDFFDGWQYSRWRAKIGSFWRKKIDRIVWQDKRDQRRLRFAGWKVLRVWTHDVTRNPIEVVGRIKRELAARKTVKP